MLRTVFDIHIKSHHVSPSCAVVVDVVAVVVVVIILFWMNVFLCHSTQLMPTYG